MCVHFMMSLGICGLALRGVQKRALGILGKMLDSGQDTNGLRDEKAPELAMRFGKSLA